MMSSPVTSQILDGKRVADELLASLTDEMAQLKAQGAPLPKLVVVLVGDDPASQVYVKKKARVAEKIGMLSELLTFPGNITQAQLNETIERLNADDSVQAILVQLPLPRQLDTLKTIDLIAPEKDVDGLHPLSLGRLLAGIPGAVAPCTPAGVIRILKSYNIPMAGKHAVVVGRSNIVGKPMGLLLLQENATVSYCHSRTADLRAITRQADILIAAVGIPKMIKGDDVSEGCVVVDVGINRLDGALVGDVDFDSVAPKASYITPVPGGVGPMTIATLMANTLALYRHAQNRK